MQQILQSLVLGVWNLVPPSAGTLQHEHLIFLQSKIHPDLLRYRREKG